MKKGVIIFFPNHHLAYSPTTINLYHSLKEEFDVKIIAPYPSQFNNQELPFVNVEYFVDRAPSVWMKVKALLFAGAKNIANRLFFRESGPLYSIQKALLKYDHIFREAALKYSDHYIIAVDILFFKIATKHFKKVNFVSLELNDDVIPLLRSIQPDRIQSVIIQTDDRYEYLFGNKPLRKFLIQNSVVFEPNKIGRGKQPNTVIFNGTASGAFGFFYFLEFLKKYGNMYTGIVKGTILPHIREVINRDYLSLIQESKLIIDDAYTETKDLISYVSQYEIGLCIYDIEAIHHNKFNYITAPSGKMFTYFASGVPIVGSDVPGLKIIDTYKAGHLIQHYSPEDILNAIEVIQRDYSQYKENCIKVASEFSFEKQALPFVGFLKNVAES